MNKFSLLVIVLCAEILSAGAQTNTFPSTGNVGIGTLSPATGYLLDVRGGISGTGSESRFSSGVYADPAVGVAYGLKVGGGGMAIRGDSYFIDEVGIGVAYPQGKLDVGGDIRSYSVGMGQSDGNSSTKNLVNFGSNTHGSLLISSNLFISGNDVLKVANTHGTMAGASILIPGNSMTNQGSIIFYTKAPSAVTANANFSGAASMIIKANGDVGIGTITPNTKLSVNGNIRAREIKVESSNWPDFVFAKDYVLPTLMETEKHIKEKGHLPGIPSAAEVEKNGIELGDMNKKLLQKIEELTLYLIEQNKQAKIQEAINQEMKSKINALSDRIEALTFKDK